MSVYYDQYSVKKESGGYRLITVPRWDSYENIPSMGYNYTSIEQIQDIWPNFPKAATFFIRSANIERFASFGITDVITENDGLFVLDNGNKFGLTYSGSDLWLTAIYEDESPVLYMSLRSNLGYNEGFTLFSQKIVTNGYNPYCSLFLDTQKRAYLYYPGYKPSDNNYPAGRVGGGSSDIFTLLFGNQPTIDDDPFSPGGTSEPGGGGGTFDNDSDEIPDSSLPTLSAANTGFTRIYNPTLSQVQAMANYLWTDDDLLTTIWNHIKQFVEDPMDAFIAFNLVPCAVPDGGTSNFKVMYIDTGVSMTVAANQFVDVDCGTVQLDRYYGSALDYTPYTRVGCFLPYIGTVELDTDEVIGSTLHVTYRIDIVSGACVAKIAVDGNILYQYSGHCAINIPFTAADFSNYVNAIIQVGKAALIAASGVPIGATAAAEPAMQLTGQTISETTVTQRNPATGRQITMGTERTERNYYQMEGTQASFKGLSPTNLANTVGAVMGSKPMIEHSGGFNGNSGYLGVRRPFLIIKRPRMCNPAGYGKLNGYPCMINEKLGNLSGYTQVQQVQLTGLSATNPEQAEILTLLKQGVIL